MYQIKLDKMFKQYQEYLQDTSRVLCLNDIPFYKIFLKLYSEKDNCFQIIVERFGARIAYIESCELVYYLPDPLISREVCEEAVPILMSAGNDIYQDFIQATKRIRGSKSLYLW